MSPNLTPLLAFAAPGLLLPPPPPLQAVQDEKDLKPSLQTESVLEHAGYKGKSLTGGKPADMAARVAAEKEGDDDDDFDGVMEPKPAAAAAPEAAAPPSAPATASEEIKPAE